MTILANTNNMMTAQNLEWYLKNSGNHAIAVWVSADEEIIDILRVEKIDVLLYFTQRVDNRELINFFFDICNVNPAVITILCIQEESRLYVSDNLRRSVDECITLPLSLADFTNLMRRSQRQPFAWNTPGTPVAYEHEQRPEPEEQVIPELFRDSEPAVGTVPVPEGVLPGITAPAPAEYFIGGIPSAQTTAGNVSNTPALPQDPVTREMTAGAVPAGPGRAPFSSPDNGAIPAAPNAANEDPRAAVPVAPPVPPGAAVPSGQTGRARKKQKKVKSPLRYLNKSELFEIILDQERRLEQLHGAVDELNSKLERLM